MQSSWESPGKEEACLLDVVVVLGTGLEVRDHTLGGAPALHAKPARVSQHTLMHAREPADLALSARRFLG